MQNYTIYERTPKISAAIFTTFEKKCITFTIILEYDNFKI